MLLAHGSYVVLYSSDSQNTIVLAVLLLCLRPVPHSLLSRNRLLAATATVGADAYAARNQRGDVHCGGGQARVCCLRRMLAAKGVRHQILVFPLDQIADHRLTAGSK